MLLLLLLVDQGWPQELHGKMELFFFCLLLLLQDVDGIANFDLLSVCVVVGGKKKMIFYTLVSAFVQTK